MAGPIAGWGGSVNITSSSNVALTNEVLTDAGDHKTFNISGASFATKRYWDRSAAQTVQAEADEMQTITITGTPTGGTFTLTFGAQTTGTLNWNATASQVQTALQALSSINAGNALVTGGPGPGSAFTVEFASSLGFASQALITLQTNSLTGGSSPSVSITRAQAGFTWTTQAATTYTIRYVTGQVLFNSAFLGTSAGCRISAGAYLPFSTFANMKQWEATPAADMYDTSTFGSQWKVYTPGLLGADLKLTQFYSDGTFYNQINGGTAFVVSCLTGRNNTERYEGFAFLKSDDIKVMVNAPEEESLNYVVTGQLYYFAGQYS